MILISTANLVILPNLVILAILVNLVDLLTPVNLDIMVILLFIGKLANSRESVDLVESFNSGESEDCFESSDSEKNLLILMRLMILFTIW